MIAKEHLFALLPFEKFGVMDADVHTCGKESQTCENACI
jgi:hypothetical protein